eukprot:11766892-Alexandrium_andersonii.AAC.1
MPQVVLVGPLRPPNAGVRLDELARCADVTGPLVLLDLHRQDRGPLARLKRAGAHNNVDHARLADILALSGRFAGKVHRAGRNRALESREAQPGVRVSVAPLND